MNETAGVWVPAVGTLCLHMVSSTSHTDIELCYRDREGDDAHYRKLLRIHNWLTETCWETFVESARAQLSTSMAGHQIVRREATLDDVVLFYRLWVSAFSAQDWIQMLVKSGKCPKDVLERLQWCYARRGECEIAQ